MAYTLFLDILNALLRLGERLLHTDVAILKQNIARRDSTSSPTSTGSPKHSLQFTLWPQTYMSMAVQPKEFLEPMSASYRFNVKSTMQSSIERFQEHAMDAIVTLVEHISSRSENIKSPFDAAFPYVNLCISVLCAYPAETGGWLTPYFRKLAKVFEHVYAMTIHTLPKQYLDESSQRVIEPFHTFLVEMLRALYYTNDISASIVYSMILEDVVKHRMPKEELLSPPGKNITSVFGNLEIDERITTSLTRENILEVALTACSLEFHNALIRSSSVDLRNRAAFQMGQLVWDIHINAQRLKADYPQLLEDYTAKFLLAKDVVGYLLGPQSHATLIGKTPAIIAFMAVTGTLTIYDADTIWAVSFNSQQPDDAQSAMGMLRVVSEWMPSFTKRYFCNKFRVLPLSQLTKDAEQLLHTLIGEFLRTSTDGEYESIFTCVSLLSKIEDPDIPPAKQNALLAVFAHVLGTIHSPRSTEETIRLIELCTGPITSLSRNATGYVQALVCILNQKNISVQPHEVYGRLTFQKCVQELTAACKRAQNDARLLVANALCCRLDLMTQLLSISSPTDNTADSEKTLWQHVLGEDATTPVLRNVGWRFFTRSFQAKHPGLEAFNRRLIKQYLPQISAESATLETVNFFKSQYARFELDETVSLSLDEELIRFALGVPSEELAKGLLAFLMERLFRGKALKHPDLVEHHQLSVVKKLIPKIAQKEVSATRAAEMLLRILVESNQFRINVEQSGKSASGRISQTKPKLPPHSIQIPIRIHKGNNQPQSGMVIIKESANCSELDAAIASETGFANYTVVAAGQKINFTEEPGQSIKQLGLGDGRVLIVQKRSTFASIQEELNESAGRSIIEEEIVSHLDVLYGTLDETSRKAQSVLQILERLKFPGPIRAMITDPETPFEQIFPSGLPLRVRASIEVISHQLKEQVALGVADEHFLLRGVHLLVELLYRTDPLQETANVCRTAETLLELLRERPLNDMSAEYFQDAAKFTHQVLCLVHQASDNTALVDRDSYQQFATRALYQCLMESVLLSHSVCSAFIAADAAVTIHLGLLLTGNDHLRAAIPKIIANAIQDERASHEFKAFFSKLSLEHLISAALQQPLTCENAFLVSSAALAADQSLASNEELLRSLIDRFAKILLEMRHLERFGNCFVDKRVSGLVSLLHCCVHRLVNQDKALNLENLASQLFKALLFPTLSLGKNLLPILAVETRDSIYNLLCLMCDNVQTVEDLSQDCKNVTGYLPSDRSVRFPGPAGFIRQEGNCAGLANMGQTCYFNSLIQQLYMNPLFRRFVFDTPVLDSKKQTVLAELKLAFASMQDSHEIFYQPDNLVKALDIDTSAQDDAHIFFMTLIGQLEQSMPDDEAKDALKRFFRGVNKSQTVGSCKHVSESTDEYFNLSLVVKDKASLEDSLEEYTKGATLEGSDRFRCTTCGSGEGVPVDAVQRTAFEHIPDNLVLGLRRFRYETYDGGQKVNDRFDFPERIDMSKYKLNRLAGVEVTNEPDVFQLVGVVVHSGVLAFGHYWSYAAERGRSDGGPLRWFRFEDRNVRISSIEEVLCETRGGLIPNSLSSFSRDRSPSLRQDNAYVLFYQRVTSVSESKECLASSTSLLPYASQVRVGLPQDIELKITKDNEEKILYLHLFSLRHTEFVRGLTEKLDTLRSLDPDTSSRATYKLMSMLLRHYIRVVASFDNEFSPQSIDFMSLLLQKLACRRKDFARWMLEAILIRRDEEDQSKSIVLHPKRRVRLATNRLIVVCFQYLREHDPNYVNFEDEENVMVSSIRGLLHLHVLLLDMTPAVWWEYFDLIRQVAELGFEETSELIHAGVLPWCLEILFVKEDAVLQRKRPEIVRYIERISRAPNYASILNCIYGLLRNFVDLRGRTARNEDERRTDECVLLLTEQEYGYLCRRANQGANRIAEDCMQGMDSAGSSWRDWPPIELVALLTNANRVSHELYNDAVQALMINLECASDWDVISETVLSCLVQHKMNSTTEEDIFTEMKRIMHSSEAKRENSSAPGSLFWIVEQVHKIHPLMMLGHLATLAVDFLVCDKSEVEKDARDWLRNDVLVQSMPSKPYTLAEVIVLRQKICSIKELITGLGNQLHSCIGRGEAFNLYEYSIDAYQDCSTFLSQTSSRLETELEEWLKSEAPDTEADIELENAVQELFDEVEQIVTLLRNHEELRDKLRDWQDERSSSDGPSNSHIIEIDDGES